MIAVEIQRSRNDAKLTRWPLYATTLADMYGCLAIVLVLASSPSIGQWARSIHYSYGSVDFTPRVLDATSVKPATPMSTLEESIVAAWVRADTPQADDAIKMALSKLQGKDDFDWLISGFDPSMHSRIELMTETQQYRWFDVIMEERAEKAAKKAAKEAAQRATKEATYKTKIEEQALSKRTLAAATVKIAQSLTKIAQLENTEDAWAEAKEAQEQALVAQQEAELAEAELTKLRQQQPDTSQEQDTTNAET